jgi:hypothetical protein
MLMAQIGRFTGEEFMGDRMVNVADMRNAKVFLPTHRKISVGKPPTHQDSTVVNCRVQPDLQRTRANNVRKIHELDANYRIDSIEGQGEDEDYAEKWAINDDEEAEGRPSKRQKKTLVNRVFYMTGDNISAGTLAVNRYELAFIDPDHIQESTKTGVRNDPFIFTAFNNYILNWSRRPIFLGVVDKYGDLRGSNPNDNFPNTAVVATAGTRLIAYWNSDNIPAFAGDLIAYRFPKPPRVVNGKMIAGTNGGAFDGTPPEKLLPETVAINLGEQGSHNVYTNLVSNLLHGEAKCKLREYLETIGEYVSNVIGISAQVKKVYEEGTALESHRITDNINKALDDWENSLPQGEPGELGTILTRSYLARGTEEPEYDEHRSLFNCLLRTVFLCCKTVALQHEIDTTQTIGVCMANAANGSAAEVLLCRRY